MDFLCCLLCAVRSLVFSPLFFFFFSLFLKQDTFLIYFECKRWLGFWYLLVSTLPCMSCLIVFAISVHYVPSSEITKIVPYARLNHKDDFHILRCFCFCSMSLPLHTSESELYLQCSFLIWFVSIFVTISLFLKLNECPRLGTLVIDFTSFTN